MKRIAVKSTVLVMVTMMIMTVFSFATFADNGNWVKDSDGWTYQVGDSVYKSQWAEIDGEWYYFDSTGHMESNCYRDGCWLTRSGAWDKSTTRGSWKHNDIGWWFQDGSWYPVNRWLWIDGKCYFFNDKGYMESNCYRNGCWLTASGAWDKNYSHGAWKQNSKGWWYEDNGWYPKNEGLWIDGKYYWFNESGYWDANGGKDPSESDIIELPFVPAT